jgi:hypothetical protein
MPAPNIPGLPTPEQVAHVPEVADAIAKLRKLQAAARKALDAFGPVHSGKAEQEARTADAQLLKDAATAGKDVAAVGTPNADKLRADREAYNRVKLGHDGAVGDQVQVVAALLIEHADALVAGFEEKAEKAAAGYAKSAAATRRARADLVEQVELRQFIADRRWVDEKATDALAPRPRKYQTSHLTKGLHPIQASTAFEAMDREAETVMRVEQPHPTKVSGPSGLGYTPPTAEEVEARQKWSHRARRH